MDYMTLRSAILKAARPLAQFMVEAGGFRTSAFSRMFQTGSSADIEKHVGDVYDNSVVAIGLNWMMRNWADAPLTTERLKAGKWEPEPGHYIVEDWADPNPWYGDDTLTDGLVTSLVAAGNGFVAPLRRNSGRAAFVFLPYHNVDIEGGSGASLIDRYVYRVPGSGVDVPFAPDDMLHFRVGNDLRDQKKGLSPLAALRRDIAIVNMASTYSAALLRNRGIPGAVFTPSDNLTQPTPEQARMFRDGVREVLTLDGAGALMVMPFPGKIEFPDSSPEKMALDTLMSVPTAKVLAAIGLSDIALGLPSESKTYDNYTVALEAAWENCLIPMKTRVARTLTVWGRRFYGEGPDWRVTWDYSDVRALQPDMDKMFTRLNSAFDSGWLKRSEARAEAGLEWTPEDEVYKSDIVNRALGEQAMASASAKARAWRAEQERV